MDDQIDQSMILEEFGGLESRRQVLVRRFPNDARPSKSYHAFRLSQDEIAERSEAGHDTRRGWMGENGDVRQSCFGVATQRPAGLCHLHEAKHPFVHAGAARGGNDDYWPPILRAALDQAGYFFTDDGTHRCGKETKIHSSDGDRFSLKRPEAGLDGIFQTGLFLITFQSLSVGRHSLEAQDIDGEHIGIEFGESSWIDQVVDSFLGRQREMIIALRADFKVLHELEVMDDLATVGASLPKSLWHFPFFVGCEL